MPLDPEGPGTYVPSDDTALMVRALSSVEGGNCLEIGFGSGAVLQALHPRFSLVVGTDIVTVGQARAAKGSSEAVLADRGSCFRDGTFDVVAFNPPYLPSGVVEDRTVDGGRGGVEVPMRFLEDALRVVKAEGKILRPALGPWRPGRIRLPLHRHGPLGPRSGEDQALLRVAVRLRDQERERRLVEAHHVHRGARVRVEYRV